jgi:hypothetical protein
MTLDEAHEAARLSSMAPVGISGSPRWVVLSTRTFGSYTVCPEHTFDPRSEDSARSGYALVTVYDRGERVQG